MKTQFQYEAGLIESWIESPRTFVREALLMDERLEKVGKRVTHQQEEAIEAIRRLVSAKLKHENNQVLNDNEKKLIKKIGISIMSGKGTGKDAFTSWMILWFLCCFPDALIPCTANTGKQLRNVLWGETYKWLRGSKIESWFVWQAEKIYFKPLDGKKWYAIALTANVRASEDEQAEMLSGLHENHMMVVIDEASGIPDAIFRPLETTLTWPLNFVLMIFNPTRRTGFAVDSQTKFRDEWICLQWNSEDSEIVTREQINRIAKKYGRDSNMFRTHILGLPPEADPDALIPYDWIMDAVDREVDIDPNDPVILGVDVGAGGDPSIIATRWGPKITKLELHNTKNTMELAGWVIIAIDNEDAHGAYIDVIGLGNGVFYRIKEHPDKELTKKVWPIDVRFRAINFIRFEGLRDELWFNLRDQFQERLISIPDDSELIGELSILKYHTSGSGKIRVTGKEEFRRQGKSINKADAIMMSYCPMAQMASKRKHKSVSKRKMVDIPMDCNNFGWLGT